MPVSDSEVQLAIASGLSMVCATCAKWHRAHALGLSQCQAQDGCGSPIVEDTFHEYEGPITNFLKLCFVCGGTPTKAIRVRGHARLIGACDSHVEYVSSHVPTAAKPRRHLPTVIDSEGERPLIRASSNKRSLAQTLLEMEKGTFKAD